MEDVLGFVKDRELLAELEKGLESLPEVVRLRVILDRLKGRGHSPEYRGKGFDKTVYSPYYGSPYVLKIASEGFIAMESREREYIRPENMRYWAPTLFLRFFEVQQFGWPVKIKFSPNCTADKLQPAKDAAKLDGFEDLGNRIANFCLFGDGAEPKIVDANHTSRHAMKVLV